MGARFSCKASETVQVVMLNRIRVVHLDGSLEDYQDPTTVHQVISNFPNHFLCTPIDILQSGLVPLKLDQQLKSGQIYFILPNSTLKFNAAPVDLTSLIRKLTNIAKTGRCSAKSIAKSPSEQASPLCNPQAASPGKYLDRGCAEEGLIKSNRSPPWKPILATITEG